MATSRAVIVSQEIRVKTPKEDIDYVADFTDILDGATITSITGNDPNAIALGVTVPAGLTEVGTASIFAGGTVDGRVIAASQAVQFGIFGGTSGETFEIPIVVRTSDGNTRELICRIAVFT